jgi:hypothetical protein
MGKFCLLHLYIFYHVNFTLASIFSNPTSSSRILPACSYFCLISWILSRVSDRRRGIGLTIGFITVVHSSTIQLGLSGHPQSSNSRLTISQQLRSHRNRCNPGNRRTPGSLPSLDTNSLTHQPKLSNNFLLLRRLLQTPATRLTTESSKVYDLWTDCREDSALALVV